ncbi:MAG: (Fe-S)-binding protein [Deltaproteobacteria bacterium]|nr:(Fe-S)-binding protein [Deltaproteobacteria bacterium]
MALEDYRNDMMRCVRCSSCKFIPLGSIVKSWQFAYGCPASKQMNFHSYSGSGKLIAALSWLDGRIGVTPELLDVVYRCSLCGLCDVSCRMGTDMEVYEILHQLRKKLVAEGHGPMPAHKPVIESVRNYDNVWVQPRNRRGRWAKGLSVKDLSKGKEKAEVLYFVGCTYSYASDLMHIPRLTAELFTRAGVDFGILGARELCCASPVYMVGQQDLYEEYAKKNIAMFNELGVKKVVTSCAGCYGVFRSKYPLLGEDMDFEVVHAEEYLAELIGSGALVPKNKVDLSVTFHDPCHTGRMAEIRAPSGGGEECHLGCLPVKNVEKVLGFDGSYDAPREILAAIPQMKFSEMERIREYSFCCGSGGGAKSAFPDFALSAASDRVEEAMSTGAEALVTNCPWCEKNFADAVRETGAPIRVVDTIELLAQSL